VTGINFRGSTLVFNDPQVLGDEQSENAAGQKEESTKEKQNQEKERQQEQKETRKLKDRKGATQQEEVYEMSRIQQKNLGSLRKKKNLMALFNSRRNLTDEVERLLAYPDTPLERITLNYDSEGANHF
jgi:hypothetical protein